MSDVKIKVINSNELIKAIDAGSYDINLSAEVIALGAATNAAKEPCSICKNLYSGKTLYSNSDWKNGIRFEFIYNIKFCPVCGRELKKNE